MNRRSQHLQLPQQPTLTGKVRFELQQQIGEHYLKFANPLLQLHSYWKSKVIQVHCNWKKVTDIVTVDLLDKASISVEKKYENHKMHKFKPGNRVKIIGSNKRLFKLLHKKVGMWKENLTGYIDKEAIVMSVSSPFAIVVSLIENGQTVQIHGFALELVEEGELGDIWKNNTDFKINDEIVIGVDNGVLAYLQKSVRKTPFNRAVQFSGYIARVIAFYNDEVVVTFDEMTHEMFNPAALQLYTEVQNKSKKKSKSQLHIRKTEKHAMNIIGEQVIVKPDLTIVMDLQKEHGGWHYKITKFIGKVGTVVECVQGGDFIVKFNPFESYRMHSGAVDFPKKGRRRTKSGHFSSIDITLTPFDIGDIVRLKIDTMDLCCTLQILRIPPQFVTIVGGFAVFVGYVDKNKGVIDFGDGVEFIFDLNLLIKIGAIPSDYVKKLMELDNNIGVGKEVVLWVGPKGFATLCINSTFKDGFEKALTEVATVQGYHDNGRAIIKYPDDDNLYSLPDELLCSPRDQWNVQVGINEVLVSDWSKAPIGIPTAVSSVECELLHSITEVLKNDGEDAELKWRSIITDAAGRTDTKIIDIVILVQLKNHGMFFENIQKRLTTNNLTSEIHDNQIIVRAHQQIYHMNVCFEASENSAECSDLSNHENRFTGFERSISLNNKLEEDNISSDNSEIASDKVSSEKTVEDSSSASLNETYEESFLPKNSSTPFGQDIVNIRIPVGVRQVVLQIGQMTATVPSQVTPTEESTSNNNQPDSIIGNPVPTTVINMYGDGENKVNIDKSNVREVVVNQA